VLSPSPMRLAWSTSETISEKGVAAAYKGRSKKEGKNEEGCRHIGAVGKGRGGQMLPSKVRVPRGIQKNGKSNRENSFKQDKNNKKKKTRDVASVNNLLNHRRGKDALGWFFFFWFRMSIPPRRKPVKPWRKDCVYFSEAQENRYKNDFVNKEGMYIGAGRKGKGHGSLLEKPPAGRPAGGNRRKKKYMKMGKKNGRENKKKKTTPFQGG